MFTADAHCDTLYRLTTCHYTQSQVSVTPERLVAGHVGLQTFALFSGMTDHPGTPASRAQDMLDAIPLLGVPIIRGALPDVKPDAPHGILSIEGGEILEGSLDRLHHYHNLGIRMITLTWNYENEIAHPAAGKTANNLKPFGHDLIAEMDALGVLCDISHLNDAGSEDVFLRSKLPVIASHSNLRTITDAPRNLLPWQVHAIIEKRGFIGINFHPGFLTTEPVATFDDILRHIDALCELGAESVLGFGSDFDGIDSTPQNLDSPADFPALLNYLSTHGYTQSQLEAFAGGNLWRVLKEAERGS